jgi:hypothetical protein
MLDQRDNFVGPRLGIRDGEIVTVDAQKMPHRLKGGALITLFESVRLRDPSHQNNRKHNYVFFSKPKEVSRPR